MSRLLLALALALPVACRDKNSEAIERWEAVDVRSAVAESIRDRRGERVQDLRDGRPLHLS